MNSINNLAEVDMVAASDAIYQIIVNRLYASWNISSYDTGNKYYTRQNGHSMTTSAARLLLTKWGMHYLRNIMDDYAKSR